MSRIDSLKYILEKNNYVPVMKYTTNQYKNTSSNQSSPKKETSSEAEAHYENALRKQFANYNSASLREQIGKNESQINTTQNSAVAHGLERQNTVLRKILYERETQEAQTKNSEEMHYENALRKQYGNLSSSELTEKINANDRAIANTKSEASGAGYIRQNNVLTKLLREARTREKKAEKNRYYDLVNEPDFQEKSKEIKKLGLFGDPTYQYINNIDGYGDFQKLNPSDSYLTKYDYLSTDEKDIYNYLYSTKGKKEANTFLEKIEIDLDRRKQEEILEYAEDFAEDHPVISSIGTVAAMPLRAVDAVGAFVKDVKDVAILGNDLNIYSDYHTTGKATETIRQSVSDQIEATGGKELPFIGNWKVFLYNASMGIADFAVDALVTKGLLSATKIPAASKAAKKFASALSNVMINAEGAANTIYDNKEKGNSDIKALGLGVANFIVNYASEKVSLDYIMKEPKTTLSNVFKSFAAEGSEEVSSDLVNNIIDQMANGSNSDISKQIDAYIKQGDGKYQATVKAYADALIPSFLAGGLSGAAFGTVYNGPTIARQNSEYRKIGEEFSDYQNEIVQTGLKRPKESEAYKNAVQLSKNIKNNKKITNLDIGRQIVLNNNLQSGSAATALGLTTTDAERIPELTNIAKTLSARGERNSLERVTNSVNSSVDMIANDVNRIVGARADTTPLVESNVSFVSDTNNLITPKYIQSYAEYFTNTMKEKKSKSYSDIQERTDNVADEFARYAMGEPSIFDGSKEFKTVLSSYQNGVNNAITASKMLRDSIYGENTNPQLVTQVTQYLTGNKSVIRTPSASQQTTVQESLTTPESVPAETSSAAATPVNTVRSKEAEIERALINSTNGIARRAASVVGNSGDITPLVDSNRTFISSGENLISPNYINSYAKFFAQSLSAISSPTYERLRGKTNDLAGELTRFAMGETVSQTLANDKDFLSVAEPFQAKLNESIQISHALHNLIYGKNPVLDVQVSQYLNGDKRVIRTPDRSQTVSYPASSDTENSVDTTENNDTIEESTERSDEKSVQDGKTATVFTNDNQEILIRYKVVSANDLIVSNHLDGSVNKNYPQELQPRERTRVSSAAQVRNMANNIVPERLGESANVSDGAPIVGSDNVVESGNGRTMALKMMYQINTEGAERYIRFIKDNAEKFGIDAGNLPAQPVLVRERLTNVDRVDFVRQANESTLSAMSATELAQIDANRMTDDVLQLLVPNDDGNLNTADNKAFISAVIAKVFPNNDLNSVVSANGKLSANGLERITNAIFFKAYGDTSLAARLSESLDNDIKNVTKVLLNIAPKIVKLKNGIQNGSYYDLDFSKNLVDAVDFLQTAKKEKLSVEDLSKQTTLLEDVPEVTKAIACVFEQKNRGAKQATEFLNILLDVVMAEDPNQESLLQDESLTKEGAFDEAIRQFNGRQEDGRREIKIPQGIVFQGRGELSQTDDGRGIHIGDRNDGSAHGDEQKETGSHEVQRPAAKAEADSRTEGTAPSGRGRGETASGLSRTNETEVVGRTAGGKPETLKTEYTLKYDTDVDSINNKIWYHGSGTDNLSAGTLTPNYTKIEGLFGAGIYLTDNKKIAEGYAKARGKNTNKPTVYEAVVDVNKVIDLEKPMPKDVYNIFKDELFSFANEYGYEDMLQKMDKLKDGKGREVYRFFSDALSEISQTERIPKAEFYDVFDEITIKLEKLGYDAYSHVGGGILGKTKHHVLVLLDPNGEFSTDAKKSVLRFDKSTGADNRTNKTQALDLMQTEDDISFSIDEDFEANYDKWVENGRRNDISLTVGRTSKALKSIGIEDKDITFDSGKINKILKKHVDMSDDVIKQIPTLLENPVIIMQSLQSESRVTVLGEVYDSNGKPVLAVLELRPKNRGNIVLDEIKIASTYGKNNVQSLIDRSDVLYIDPDKNRTNNWLAHNRLQLPLGQLNYGSIKRITYPDGNVNRYSMQSGEKNSIENTQKFSINEDFEANYDKWVEDGRPDRQVITVGKTSDALKSIGVKNQTITWDTSKINKSLKKHRYLNDSIMKQIPDILENPIIVMQSRRSDSRITMFGEVTDGDGLPVMAVLELLPTNREGTVVLDEIKIVSTHSRKTGKSASDISQTQSLIHNSEILYLDPNKNRTDSWFTSNRLQLPLDVTNYGSIKRITYPDGNVNSDSMQKGQNLSEEREENYEGKGNLLSDDIGGRQDGSGARKQAKGLDERAGTGQEGRKAILERRKFAQALKAAGAVTLKTQNGVRAHFIEKSHYNSEMQQISDENAKLGVQTEFIIGGAIIPFTSGKRARGVFDYDTDTALIQYDHDTFSPFQINRHELVHKDYKSKRVQKVKNIILNSLSVSERLSVKEKLSRDYNGIMEGNEDAVLEEFICNVLAGMNEYSVEFAELSDAYWSGEETVDRYNPAEYTESVDSGGTALRVSRPSASTYPSWVYETLDGGELRKLESALMDIRIGNDGRFVRTRGGEYIVQTDNKLIYTNGDYDNPEISKIIEFHDNYETNIDDARRMIYGAEKRGEARYRSTLQAIEDAFGKGFLYVRTDSTNAGFAGRGEGENSGENTQNRSKKSRRAERDRRIIEAARRGISFDDDGNPNVQFSAESTYPSWVYEMLDGGELRKLESALMDIRIGNDGRFVRTRGGEYIVQTDNKLIYTNGDYDNPEISKIIEFNSDYEPRIDEARRRIYEAEKGRSDVDTTLQAIEIAFGKGFLNGITGENFRANGGFAGGRKGRTGGSTAGNRSKSAQRRERTRRIIEAARRGISFDDEGKPNVRFSLDDGSDDIFQNLNTQEDYDNAINQLIDRYGSIPPGEIPAREVSVPKKTANDRPVSQFARTMMEAGVTPDETVSEFEKMILNGTMTHEVITNKSAQEHAEERINYLGYEDALKEWDSLVENDKVDKNVMALGMLLYNTAVTNKDTRTAMKLASDLVGNATKAGQALQSTRMLKMMTPDGQLYFIEKSVQKLLKELKEKLGKRFSGNIEINEELAKKFLEAKTEEERNRIYDEICQDIADQIPTTWRDRLNSWRYLSMLGNPRTHIRNIVGNAVFYPAVRIKNYIGAALERTAGVKTQDRTKSVRKSKAAKEFAKSDSSKVEKMLKGQNAKYAITDDIESKRKIFRSKAFTWLEKARKKNFDLLEKEDWWFLRAHYEDSLARVITARKINPQFLSSGTKEANDLLEKVRGIAISEAQAATYRDANAAAEAFSAFKHRLARGNQGARVANVFFEGLMPFTKTPANILKQGIYYSPVGLVQGIYQVGVSLRSGAVTATDAINSLSRGLTGTGILFLGMLLNSLGLIKGRGEDEDKEDDFNTLVGEQDYALVFGDKSYTIDWMAPISLPLFVGVEVFSALKDDGATLSDVVGAMEGITDPMLELSVLQGISSTISSASYSKNNALTSVLSNMLQSYVGQFFPTVGGQIARSIDNKRRLVYFTDKNSSVPPIVQTTLNQILAKVPGATRFLQAQVDQWGREKNYGGTVERLLENTISPGYYSEENYTYVDKELKKLYDRTKESSVLPSNAQKTITQDKVTYYLNAYQYTEFSKLRGKQAFENVYKVLTGKEYSKANDEKKIKLIKKCYDDAQQFAKEQMFKRGILKQKS